MRILEIIMIITMIIPRMTMMIILRMKQKGGNRTQETKT